MKNPNRWQWLIKVCLKKLTFSINNVKCGNNRGIFLSLIVYLLRMVAVINSIFAEDGGSNNDIAEMMFI